MRIFSLTTTLALFLSLLSKYFADTFLHTRVAIVGSFLGLDPVQNPGVAFGIRLPAIFQEVIIVAALVFVCVLAYRSERIARHDIGYGLIVGGALGNLLDRLTDGLVTDFFQVSTFPVFNVADSCITIGVCFLLADLFLSKRHH